MSDVNTIIKIKFPNKLMLGNSKTDRSAKGGGETLYIFSLINKNFLLWHS